MRFGSVCSGIEAASAAWEPLGWAAAWLAEIEPFPAAVLAHRFPGVKNLGDMTLIARSVLTGDVEAPDVLVGGTPCQAFSVAGMREGLADSRGQLTIKFVELADAIDFVRRRRGQCGSIIVWENVPGVLSSKDNAFGCFLGALAGEDCELKPPGKRWADAGCVFGPQRAIAWRVLDAQYFQLAQRRRRVFVVASAREGFDPAAVLFEFEGVRRDTPPRREARQTAPAIPARSTGGGGLGTDFDCDGGLIHVDPIARCVTAGEAKRQDWETCNFVAFHPTQDPISSTDGSAHAQADGPSFTLNAMHGHDMHAVAVPVGVTIHGTDPTVQKVASYDELAQCLRARTPGNIDNSSTTVVQQPVAYGIRTANTSSNGWGVQEEVMHTLDCAQGVAVAQPVVYAIQAGALRVNPASGPDGVGVQADHAYTLEARAEVQAVAVALRGREGGATAELGDDLAGCLRASSGGGDKPHALTGMAVRRLTPVECERLQGFPDGWTDVPYRGKPAADSPRYKAIGNSMAVPVMHWIGKQIEEEAYT